MVLCKVALLATPTPFAELDFRGDFRGADPLRPAFKPRLRELQRERGTAFYRRLFAGGWSHLLLDVPADGRPLSGQELGHDALASRVALSPIFVLASPEFEAPEPVQVFDGSPERRVSTNRGFAVFVVLGAKVGVRDEPARPAPRLLKQCISKAYLLAEKVHSEVFAAANVPKGKVPTGMNGDARNREGNLRGQALQMDRFLGVVV